MDAFETLGLSAVDNAWSALAWVWPGDVLATLWSVAVAYSTADLTSAMYVAWVVGLLLVAINVTLCIVGRCITSTRYIIIAVTWMYTYVLSVAIGAYACVGLAREVQLYDYKIYEIDGAPGGAGSPGLVYELPPYSDTICGLDGAHEDTG
jgi:hypothetical protein